MVVLIWAFYHIFRINLTKDAERIRNISVSSDILFRRAMKVVAVDEEEDRYVKEQTKELEREEWEVGEREKDQREGGNSEREVGGSKTDERERGNKKWEVGGREDQAGRRNKEVRDCEREEEKEVKGENDEREERKRDCLQSMLKLRL